MVRPARPSRWSTRRNASRLPSRDHAGKISSSSCAPARGLTKTWKPLPSGRTAAKRPQGCALRPVQPNTIVRPSGDQAGWMPSVAPRPARRRLRPVPSALTIHSPMLMRRGTPLPKTIWRSPGPQLTPEQSVVAWPTRRTLLPSLFITNSGQTFGPCAKSWRTKAIRLPSRDQAGACSPLAVNCRRRPFG